MTLRAGKKLIDGDSLIVPSKANRSNPIAVEGDAEISELIGWSEGLRISDYLRP